jgi:hypothetical protein
MELINQHNWEAAPELCHLNVGSLADFFWLFSTFPDPDTQIWMTWTLISETNLVL